MSLQSVSDTCLGLKVGYEEGLCQQKKANLQAPPNHSHLEEQKPARTLDFVPLPSSSLTYCSVRHLIILRGKKMNSQRRNMKHLRGRGHYILSLISGELSFSFVVMCYSGP